MFHNKYSSVSWILYILTRKKKIFCQCICNYIPNPTPHQIKMYEYSASHVSDWWKMAKLLSETDSIIVPPFCSNPTKHSIPNLPIMGDLSGKVQGKASTHALYKNRCFCKILKAKITSWLMGTLVDACNTIYLSDESGCRATSEVTTWHWHQSQYMMSMSDFTAWRLFIS